MQALEVSIESERGLPAGLYSENAREFENVVSRNLPIFYKMAFRSVGNDPDAEDAVQDALLSACRHLAQFRGQARMSTWLTAIVINAARLQLRRRRGVYVSLEQQSGEDGLSFSEQLPDSKPGPEEACYASEARDRLLAATRQLSPTLRGAFQVHDIDGLTAKEVATALGVPEGTVKARVARARAKLARIMRAKPGRQRSRTV